MLSVQLGRLLLVQLELCISSENRSQYAYASRCVCVVDGPAVGLERLYSTVGTIRPLASSAVHVHWNCLHRRRLRKSVPVLERIEVDDHNRIVILYTMNYYYLCCRCRRCCSACSLYAGMFAWTVIISYVYQNHRCSLAMSYALLGILHRSYGSYRWWLCVVAVDSVRQMVSVQYHGRLFSLWWMHSAQNNPNHNHPTKCYGDL